MVVHLKRFRGKLYLAAILDLFSRFIVGWAVGAANDRHLNIKALESESYQDLLAAHGITCSMSRRGNCYDKEVMESCFPTVKSELDDRFDSFGKAKMELFDYIEVFYNWRRHSTLGQVSPAAFERRAATQAA